MRLLFLGSPTPAIAPLQTLLTEGQRYGHEVVAVVSQPARPVGRRGVLVDPPVAAYAKEKNLLVLQPEKASDPEFIAALKDLQPDVAITAAYGQILPQSFLSIPRRATINIHPSLLPKYRGATPVPAALIDGCTESGVTILFTVARLDAGAIILQEKSAIDPHETAAPLTERLFVRGGELLWDALKKLEDQSYTGTPQDEQQVTFCRKIDKNDGLVNWQMSCEDIYNRFRAFEPWPGSFTFHGDKRLAIVEMHPDPNGMRGLKVGEAIFDKKSGTIKVGAGEGTMVIDKLKPAGGKVIQAAAFWNGLKDRSHVIFTQGIDAP